MLDISVRSNIKELEKKLDAFVRKQLPFATAQALTATAKAVQTAERENMVKMLDKPTPFTLNSVKVKAARKNDLEALVFVQDIAAAYLEPFETGGLHKLIGRGVTWLNPKDKSLLNQYGNLSKSALASLKGRSDIFIGKVKGKSGQVIDGVWQRTAESATRTRVMKNKKVVVTKARGLNQTGQLKLLVRFGDAIPVTHRLGYADRAKATVGRVFNKEMGKALAKAIASAK